jgi:flagellar biosynthesis GTPase FlhF
MVGYVPAYQIRFENPESSKVLKKEYDEIRKAEYKVKAEEYEKAQEEAAKQRRLEAEQRRQQLQAEAEARKKAKEQRIRSKYSSRIANKILNRTIWIGMTKEMLIDSWGQPSDDNINRSVGSWGVHEQWIYGDTYVYLENGKVTSWQD